MRKVNNGHKISMAATIGLIAVVSSCPDSAFADTPWLRARSSISCGVLDTREVHTVSVDGLISLDYSKDAWGESEDGSVAQITISRNKKASRQFVVQDTGTDSVLWRPTIWGTNTLTLSCGTYKTSAQVIVEGPVGDGTVRSPYIVEDEEDISRLYKFGAFGDDFYITTRGIFTPKTRTGSMLETGDGVYAFKHIRGSLKCGKIDTRPMHTVSPGYSDSLAYSVTGWDDSAMTNDVFMTCSRNGRNSIEVGKFTAGEGASDWSVAYWGTNVLTYKCGDYITNHTFIVEGIGSGKRLDPYVVTDDEDLAAFLPRGLDDFVYVTPWSGYNLVAPEGYMLDYQFGVYRLSRYIAPSCVRVASVKQRYPWNGLVDVAYEITGAREDHEYELTFYIRTAKGTAAVLPRSSPHRVNEYDGRVANGTYTTLVNLDPQFSEVMEKGAAIYAILNDKGAIAWPTDATGTPVGILADVMTVDVSGGSSAASYPVAYYKNVDTGRFNCDIYRTNKVAMVKIDAGRYTIGQTEFTHEVTTRGFYIGLFEVTQSQYAKVVGSVPSGQQTVGNRHPVSMVSWSILRGSSTSVAARPTGVFLSNLQSRAGCGGTLEWDLPTEAQWEIAARGDSVTSWVSETEDGLSEYAWLLDETQSSSRVVGTKRPNAFGLYDVQGSVWEWCRDAYRAAYDLEDADVPNATGSNRIYRGAAFATSQSGSKKLTYRRDTCQSTDSINYVGFRLFVNENREAR